MSRVVRVVEQPTRVVEVARAVGQSGDSAYEVAVSGGFVGTENDWLASLVGPPGIGVADITVDTTVGTRVFVGGVMVHGETGARDIMGSLEPDTLAPTGVTSPRFTVQRVGNQVSFVMRLKAVGGSSNLIFMRGVPTGFQQAPVTQGVVGTTRTGGRLVTVENRYGGSVLNIASFGGSSPWWDAAEITISFSYFTSQAWPTTLPGLPA